MGTAFQLEDKMDPLLFTALYATLSIGTLVYERSKRPLEIWVWIALGVLGPAFVLVSMIGWLLSRMGQVLGFKL